VHGVLHVGNTNRRMLDAVTDVHTWQTETQAH
jgi:hypothetical protein